MTRQIVAVDQAEIPRAVYGCANERCSEEVSFPADLLAYYDGRPIRLKSGEGCVDEELLPAPGWYCTESCWSDNLALWELYPEHIGPSLESEIARRSQPDPHVVHVSDMSNIRGLPVSLAVDPGSNQT